MCFSPKQSVILVARVSPQGPWLPLQRSAVRVVPQRYEGFETEAASVGWIAHACSQHKRQQRLTLTSSRWCTGMNSSTVDVTINSDATRQSLRGGMTSHLLVLVLHRVRAHQGPKLWTQQLPELLQGCVLRHDLHVKRTSGR
jgi:hypothetical protein